MQITKHEIDSAVLGRAILELSGPYDADLARLEEEYLRDHQPLYVVYKAPIEDITSINSSRITGSGSSRRSSV